MQIDLDKAGLTGRPRRFVERLLAFKPDRRFATARQALAALHPRSSPRRQWLLLGVGLALIAAAAAIGTQVVGPGPDPFPHPLPHPVPEDADAYHRPIGTEPKQR